jgi:hypothetical protein
MRLLERDAQFLQLALQILLGTLLGMETGGIKNVDSCAPGILAGR